MVRVLLMRTTLVSSLVLAGWAEPLHLELVAQDPVVHGASRLLFEARIDGHGKVVDPPAAETSDVVVPSRVAVEARRVAAGLDFADGPLLRQPLEVPVDGAEADAGEMPARPAIDPVRGGVVHRGSHHLQNDLPLARLPAQHISNHSYVVGKVNSSRDE